MVGLRQEMVFDEEAIAGIASDGGGILQHSSMEDTCESRPNDARRQLIRGGAELTSMPGWVRSQA